MLDHLLTWPQALLPHHALSRLAFTLSRVPAGPLVTLAVSLFARAVGADLSEAAQPDPRAYRTFNDFFTRALAPGARPVVGGAGEVACPVDGRVSQAGTITAGRLLQAKGRDYALADLLGGAAAEPWRPGFEGGSFATLYLSPRDYHRIHMPLAGRLLATIHVPGRLYTVKPRTTRVIPRLFARNERVAAFFDTEAGPMALVLVGALQVGSLETKWAGRITPPGGRKVTITRHRDGGVELARGEEMGRFNLGSTVIVLFGPGRIAWEEEVVAGAPVRMGRRLGRVVAPGS